jgi:hypothetical protein
MTKWIEHLPLFVTKSLGHTEIIRHQQFWTIEKLNKILSPNMSSFSGHVTA